ncbi:unnamed protein product [Adineta steineri]|uniref:Uncharacterized protein n=1 Tax=Adineta steineri TaxID=433720 RepID=A0A818MFF3_9BILA|nr:unnamed protein product [Adineta steineri]CAF3586485.1 unnamed protein product [Adineta steineri]
MNGRKCPGQLNDGYTVNGTKQLVRNIYGSDIFRLMVNEQEIQDNDPMKFAELKKSIHNTVTYVYERMNIESDMADMESHSTILFALQNELREMSTQSIDSKCMICAEEKQCLKFCCKSIICTECFPIYFIQRRYKPTCLICDQVLVPETCFKTPQFIRLLVQLNKRLSHNK